MSVNVFSTDIQRIKQRAEEINLPPYLKESLLNWIERVDRTSELTGFSSEFESMSKYADWVLSIPWNKYVNDNLDLINIKQILDSHHFGIEKVKQVILDYMAVLRLKQSRNPGSQVHIPPMLFVGLQGIGKTTMARSIAEALGRPYIRIALGALGTPLELRGKPKSELDAEPGQIVKAIIKAGVLNPVIVLDEIDKVSGEQGRRSDIMATLLEVLDPEQNTAFRDHYIDQYIDISNIMFICTANNSGPISSALLDRLQIIRFTSYSDEEKVMIAKNYLLPKVLEASGLDSTLLEIKDDVWETIVRPLGFDAGIRQLERNMLFLGRKAARQIISDPMTKVVITNDNVKDFVDFENVY
jgi:ATP-dependent Lon protease